MIKACKKSAFIFNLCEALNSIPAPEIRERRGCRFFVFMRTFIANSATFMFLLYQPNFLDVMNAFSAFYTPVKWAAALLLLAACSADRPAPESETQAALAELASLETELVFGEEFTFSPEEALAVDALIDRMNSYDEDQASEPLQLVGEVVQVCQKKGCWLTLVASDGTEMRIRFKDYGFFVPKDLPGTQVALHGVASKKVTSVATLRHYAEDEGADEQTINAITSPRTEYTFEASGVRVL